MAEAITVNAFRSRLAAQMAGGAKTTAIRFMAFGDGGHDSVNLHPVSPSPERIGLVNELLRKNLAEIRQEDTLSVTGRGEIEPTELNGAYISEAGLFDEDGKLVGYKTFSPKIKESDERYEITIKLRF
ncbi:MAG: phage tail protein [Methylovulum sp.]|jgi:phage-related tail fiber protein